MNMKRNFRFLIIIFFSLQSGHGWKFLSFLICLPACVSKFSRIEKDGGRKPQEISFYKNEQCSWWNHRMCYVENRDVFQYTCHTHISSYNIATSFLIAETLRFLLWKQFFFSCSFIFCSLLCLLSLTSELRCFLEL